MYIEAQRNNEQEEKARTILNLKQLAVGGDNNSAPLSSSTGPPSSSPERRKLTVVKKKELTPLPTSTTSQLTAAAPLQKQGANPRRGGVWTEFQSIPTSSHVTHRPFQPRGFFCQPHLHLCTWSSQVTAESGQAAAHDAYCLCCYAKQLNNSAAILFCFPSSASRCLRR